MKKVGIVVQRYGNKINGGAEYHAQLLAEKLKNKFSIDILTTKAINYHTWENEFKKNKESINNINILRFNSLKKNHKKFKQARKIILHKKIYHKVLKKTNLFSFFIKNTSYFNITTNDGENFIKQQGPNCPDLMDYIKTNNEKYDCFIFFTYLYFPSYYGLKEVGYKSIFIPTAHDEEILYSIAFKNIFSLPKFILYNTYSEKTLIENNFKNACKNSDIAGVGIDKFNLKNLKISEEYIFNFDYFIYIGRINEDKGCKELINYFLKSDLSKKIKLVLVGKNEISKKIKSHSNIVFTGFVRESDKYFLLKNSKGLIIPSKYESLSLVTLESMLHNKIVIANEKCDVLKKHILKSESGYLYNDFKSFKKSINIVNKLSKNKYKEEAEKGHQYVEKHYSWPSILNKFHKAIDFICEDNKKNYSKTSL